MTTDGVPIDALREDGMPEKMDPRVPKGAEAASWYCAACGRWAMRVMALAAAGLEHSRIPRVFAKPGSVLSESGVGQIAITPLAFERYNRDGDKPTIVELIRRADVAALYQVDLELVPLWCPQCAAVYCRDEWTMWDVWADDYSGWHEGIQGRCPRGHQRMIED